MPRLPSQQQPSEQRTDKAITGTKGSAGLPAPSSSLGQGPRLSSPLVLPEWEALKA